MTQYEQDKVAVENAAQYQSNLETYNRWLEKHPDINPCIANQKAFEEYLDWADEVTPADLDFALGNMLDRLQLATQRVPTPEETKAALIDKIIERLQTTNNKHWQIPHNVQIERAKMQFWSLEQLTARLEEIVRAQTLNALSPEERQKIVVEGRRYTGYPQLSKTVVRPGTVRAVPQDAAYLRSLDPFDLKRLCRLYGVEQVNARLAGRD
ncbi:MAG: hypothetical protein WA798_12470 [Candidatus Acidiferrum sp.]